MVLKKFKVALFMLLVFVLAAISALFFYWDYRHVAFWFFNSLDGQHIAFVGKGFYLFPSYTFVFSFGLFCVLQTWFLLSINNARRTTVLLLTILIFFFVTALMAIADCRLRLTTCTGFVNGKLTIRRGSLDYDTYFITSLVCALLPAIIARIKKRKVPPY